MVLHHFTCILYVLRVDKWRLNVESLKPCEPDCPGLGETTCGQQDFHYWVAERQENMCQRGDFHFRWGQEEPNDYQVPVVSNVFKSSYTLAECPTQIDWCSGTLFIIIKAISCPLWRQSWQWPSHNKSVSIISPVWCWKCKCPGYAIREVASKLSSVSVWVAFSKADSINISIHVACKTFVVLHCIAINDIKTNIPDGSIRLSGKYRIKIRQPFYMPAYISGAVSALSNQFARQIPFDIGLWQ